jgi:Concanavalin A-like lectin/glucanases superfamily
MPDKLTLLCDSLRPRSADSMSRIVPHLPWVVFVSAMLANGCRNFYVDNGGGSSSAYRDAVLSDGPSAYWRLDEKSGDIAHDTIHDAHPGTYLMAVEKGVPGALKDDPDTAVRFDTLGGRIDFGNIFSFENGASFSIEVWIEGEQVPVAGAYQAVLEKSIFTPVPEGWQLEVGNDGEGALVVGFETIHDGNYGPGLVSAPIQEGRFAYVVVTFDAGTIRLYVDGMPAKTESTSVRPAATSVDFVAGSEITGGQHNFVGSLDEIAIYPKALSAGQIAAHYAASGAK